MPLGHSESTGMLGNGAVHTSSPFSRNRVAVLVEHLDLHAQPCGTAVLHARPAAPRCPVQKHEMMSVPPDIDDRQTSRLMSR